MNENERFISYIRCRFLDIENSNSKEIKCRIFIKILKCLIKYSFVFDPNNQFFSEYRDIWKNKLYEFKEEKGFIGEEELHKLSLKILQRYYNECLDENRCIAYKCDNIRCIHTIKKSNVCGIHLKYPNKILNILKNYVPADISKKCVEILFLKKN